MMLFLGRLEAPERSNVLFAALMYLCRQRTTSEDNDARPFPKDFSTNLERVREGAYDAFASHRRLEYTASTKRLFFVPLKLSIGPTLRDPTFFGHFLKRRFFIELFLAHDLVYPATNGKAGALSLALPTRSNEQRDFAFDLAMILENLENRCCGPA